MFNLFTDIAVVLLLSYIVKTMIDRSFKSLILVFVVAPDTVPHFELLIIKLMSISYEVNI